MKYPIISIIVVTYNHESYIKECLDSILSQQTSYSYEIIIGEDDSSDNTQSICKRYVTQHPNKIKLLLNERKNVIYINGQATGRNNFIHCLNDAKGKYIALLDGDDYWTDPFKLQKQVDFLEQNPDFNICFTRTQLLRNNQLEQHKIPESKNAIYSFDDLLLHENFIATASVMFRNNITTYPEWFKRIPFGDMALYSMVGKNAKIKCLSDTTAIYRIHDSGVWQQQNRNRKMINKLLFNQGIFNQLTTCQKAILSKKQIKLIEQLAALKYPANKVFRVIYRSFLKLKYSLS